MESYFRLAPKNWAIGLAIAAMVGPALAADCAVNQIFTPGMGSCTVPAGIGRLQVQLLGGAAAEI